MSSSLSGQGPQPLVRPVSSPAARVLTSRPVEGPTGVNRAVGSAGALSSAEEEGAPLLPAMSQDGVAAPPRAVVVRTTELLNAILADARRQLKFHVHEGTGRIWVQVIDTRTQEVIKEIPPERYLDLVARIWELVGILVDERA